MNWTLLNFAGLAKGELKKKSIFHLRFQQYYVANSILQICFLVVSHIGHILQHVLAGFNVFLRKLGWQMLTLVQKWFALKLDILFNPESSSVSCYRTPDFNTANISKFSYIFILWCIAMVLAPSITNTKSSIYMQIHIYYINYRLLTKKFNVRSIGLI